jgi:hypothetical protein
MMVMMMVMMVVVVFFVAATIDDLFRCRNWWKDIFFMKLLVAAL